MIINVSKSSGYKEACEPYWPGLTEDEACDLLWSATCFPCGEPYEYFGQLQAAYARSMGDVEEAIRLAIGETEETLDSMPDNKERNTSSMVIYQIQAWDWESSRQYGCFSTRKYAEKFMSLLQEKITDTDICWEIEEIVIDAYVPLMNDSEHWYCVKFPFNEDVDNNFSVEKIDMPTSWSRVEFNHDNVMINTHAIDESDAVLRGRIILAMHIAELSHARDETFEETSKRLSIVFNYESN